MQFAVGYQYRSSGELFTDMVSDYRENIKEVYFAPPGFASGRPDASQYSTQALEQLIYELKILRRMNIKLDLLLNGNCYGEHAVSHDFADRINNMLEWFEHEGLLPEVVTTTSPFAAHIIKNRYREIEIRASVNMRIDSLTALEYLADKFDSFYLRRDLQRDLETVKLFSEWSKTYGKKLCLLANSGCLRNCPYQTFHDNLVAHDSQLRKQKNVKEDLANFAVSVDAVEEASGLDFFPALNKADEIKIESSCDYSAWERLLPKKSKKKNTSSKRSKK